MTLCRSVIRRERGNEETKDCPIVGRCGGRDRRHDGPDRSSTGSEEQLHPGQPAAAADSDHEPVRYHHAGLRHELRDAVGPERLRLRQPDRDRLGRQHLRAVRISVGLVLRPWRERDLPQRLRRDVQLRRLHLGPPRQHRSGPRLGAVEHGRRVSAGDDHVVHPQRRPHLHHRLRRQADDRRQPRRTGLHPHQRDEQQ